MQPGGNFEEKIRKSYARGTRIHHTPQESPASLFRFLGESDSWGGAGGGNYTGNAKMCARSACTYCDFCQLFSFNFFRLSLRIFLTSRLHPIRLHLHLAAQGIHDAEGELHAADFAQLLVRRPPAMQDLVQDHPEAPLGGYCELF